MQAARRWRGRMTDLEKLIAAVEAGTATADDFGATFPHAHHFEHTHACGAYEGSLDAAKRLHDALLQGWFPGMSQNTHSGIWFAWEQNKTRHCEGHGTDPARSWLLAILQALQAKGDA